jgi:hypothetical protein
MTTLNSIRRGQITRWQVQTIINMTTICQVLLGYWEELIRSPEHYNPNTYEIISVEAGRVNYALLLVEQYLGISTGLIRLINGDALPYDQIMGRFNIVMREISGFNNIDRLRATIYAN